MLSFERIFFGWVPEAWSRVLKLRGGQFGRGVFRFRRRVRVSESSGERQVWIEEDTSVQLRSVSWKFWHFL